MIEQETLLTFLGRLRRAIIWIGVALAVCSVGTFFVSDRVLAVLQQHLRQELAYFSVTEPFMASVRLSLGISVFVLIPLVAVFLWRSVAEPFGLSRKTGVFFVSLGIVLFYAGAAFCYYITLPFGVEFLLGYQTSHVKAVISLDRFLTFCFVFILAFGIMFELPLGMVFCARIKLCTSHFFRRYRRYALLIVAIVSAVITPTPDVFNMMLMMTPLYVLYELGILSMRIMGY